MTASCIVLKVDDAFSLIPQHSSAGPSILQYSSFDSLSSNEQFVIPSFPPLFSAKEKGEENAKGSSVWVQEASFLPMNTREVRVVENSVLIQESPSILGEHNIKRFHMFAASEDGWDFGCGKRLQPCSVSTFNDFLSQSPPLLLKTSIFMTSDGFLELQTSDKADRNLTLVFQDSGVSYSIDPDELEGCFGLDEMDKLLKLVIQFISVK